MFTNNSGQVEDGWWVGMGEEGEVGEKDVEKEESRRSDRGKDALGLRTAKTAMTPQLRLPPQTELP